MATTQDIRRRIRSVKNTMQVTRAMKMVSAAKLRRAQENMQRARPYSERLLKMLQSVAARVDADANPLLQPHESDRRVGLIVFAGDKGLCGPFNSSIIRQAETFAAGLGGRDITYTCVGKRSRDHFTRQGHTLRHSWIDVFRNVEFSTAAEIGKNLVESYLNNEVDQVHLVFNEFKSALQATPIVQQLLPIEQDSLDSDEPADDYIYERDAASILRALLPHYIEIQVFRALLESAAAEHAARMTAMDSATNNAGELIDSLTLTMNRVRQASITREIIEVVSGAEALG